MTTIKRKVFHPAQLAALAASGVLVQNPPTPAAAAAGAQAEGAEKTAAAEKDAADKLAAATASTAEAEAAAAAAAASGAATPNESSEAGDKTAKSGSSSAESDNGVVSFLQAQIKEKDAAILALNLEKKELEAKASETAVTFPALLEIAATSVRNMSVALGGSALELKGMSATELLAQHKRLSTDFQTKYKAGGVAAVDATDEEESGAAAKATLDPVYKARLDAASPKLKKG